MRVSQVTVIGLGLIGGSIAKDLRAKGVAKKFVGVDTDPDHCQKAMELKLVDEVESLEDSVRASDVVILAVPVDRIVRLLPQILNWVNLDTTVVDMGSTKESICDSVKNHQKRNQFVPSHPMAGTENSGPTSALSGLFRDKTAIICDPEKSGDQHIERVKEIYTALESRLLFMSAKEHDLHVAYVSHLSHISSFALANTILDEEKSVSTIFDLASGGFSSTVRLAKSSPEMWGPIFEQNRSYVVTALESYIGQLKRFHQALVSGDSEETRSLMMNANQVRRVLENMMIQKLPLKEVTIEKASEDRLDGLRSKIDHGDYALLSALNRRFEIVQDIAWHKKILKIPIFKKNLWEKLLKDRIRLTREEFQLDSKFVRKLFELIHKESVRIQKKAVKNSKKPLRNKEKVGSKL